MLGWVGENRLVEIANQTRLLNTWKRVDARDRVSALGSRPAHYWDLVL
jgi:hypothetical protein